MSSFSDMRTLLLFLYDSESISDEEFFTLYKSYSSKNPDFPYSAYPKFDYDQIDESTEAEKGQSKNILQIPKNILNRNIILKSLSKSLTNLKNYRKS